MLRRAGGSAPTLGRAMEALSRLLCRGHWIIWPTRRAWYCQKFCTPLDLNSGLLIGHSDGATIAAIYAGTVHDPRLRGLVTIAPHFFTEEIGLTEIALAKQAFESGDLRSRLAKYHRDPDNCFRGWNDAWLHPEFKDWNVSDVLDEIRVPVLAIQGQEDQYGTLAQIDEIERRCPKPTRLVVLPDCGHDPCYERPDRVLTELTRFCADVEPDAVRPGAGS